MVIDSITKNLSKSRAINARLKKLAVSGPQNARTICDHILAEQTERNIKPNTIEGKTKVLIWLSEYLGNKPFERMTKQDILAYLNHLRKSPIEDPSQRWIGSYNGRVMIISKFFRWLYNKNEPDHRKRAAPECILGIKQLPRQEKSPYKPSDLWDAKEHEIFLKYCPSARDRCYHAMANDLSARPHELLNLRIKDIVFKAAEEMQYAEVLIRGGKTKPRTLPLIDCIPYVKEWMMQHPTGSNHESWLFISEAHNSFGQKLKRDSLLAKYQYQYKDHYFPKLLNDPTVPNADKAIIRNMLTKPWNLYVFRHSALTEKSQILTEHTLRDHAGWTMTSKMPAVYVHYFGNESAKKLLEAKGIIKPGQNSVNVLKTKPCPNCREPNKPDAKFCLKCKMVLSYDAYEVKDKTITDLQEKVQLLIESQKEFQELLKYRDVLEKIGRD